MRKPRSSSSDSGKSTCYRGHWRPEEDEKLRQLLEQHGPQNWNFISEQLEGRSGKSCRLRWYNQLDPNINKKPFTEEEEQRLLLDHRIYGNKWAFISRGFKGRTDNALKNHYHVIMARRKRERNNKNPKLGFLNFQNHENLGMISPSSSSGYQDFIAPRGPNVDKVVVPNLLRFPNFAMSYGSDQDQMINLVRLNDNSAILQNLKMASQQEQDESIADHNAVPALFIDFLGVGIS